MFFWSPSTRRMTCWKTCLSSSGGPDKLRPILPGIHAGVSRVDVPFGTDASQHHHPPGPSIARRCRPSSPEKWHETRKFEHPEHPELNLLQTPQQSRNAPSIAGGKTMLDKMCRQLKWNVLMPCLLILLITMFPFLTSQTGFWRTHWACSLKCHVCYSLCSPSWNSFTQKLSSQPHLTVSQASTDFARTWASLFHFLRSPCWRRRSRGKEIRSSKDWRKNKSSLRLHIWHLFVAYKNKRNRKWTKSLAEGEWAPDISHGPIAFLDTFKDIVASQASSTAHRAPSHAQSQLTSLLGDPKLVKKIWKKNSVVNSKMMPYLQYNHLFQKKGCKVAHDARLVAKARQSRFASPFAACLSLASMH